jgi:hypothetical protein
MDRLAAEKAWQRSGVESQPLAATARVREIIEMVLEQEVNTIRPGA